MSLIEIALIITLVTASFFVGVIAAMLSVIQRVLNNLDYATYTRIMQGIIIAGRKSPVIWTLLLLPTFSAGLALLLLRADTEEPTFIWLIVGLILFVAGPILVSRYFNEPYYDEVLAWHIDKAVAGWESKRYRWFQLNLLRFSIGTLACIALAVALTMSSGL